MFVRVGGCIRRFGSRMIVGFECVQGWVLISNGFVVN